MSQRDNHSVNIRSLRNGYMGMPDGRIPSEGNYDHNKRTTNAWCAMQSVIGQDSTSSLISEFPDNMTTTDESHRQYDNVDP